MCWSALNARVHDPAVLVEMDALETIAQMVEDGVGRRCCQDGAACRGAVRAWPDAYTIGLVHRLRKLDSPLLHAGRDRRWAS